MTYFITCTKVIKDDAGEVTELVCTYDPETRGGNAPDGRKVRGTIHWVSAERSLPAEVRLYDHLFVEPEEGGELALNPASLGEAHSAFNTMLAHKKRCVNARLADLTGWNQREPKSFQDMVRGFRTEFAAEAPVIAGELGTFLANEERPRPYVELINAQLRDLQGALPAYGFAASGGLTDLGDNVHFDAKSLREFGVRYAQKYLHLL